MHAGRLVPSRIAFRYRGAGERAGMSTDWDRYATASSTRAGSLRRPASEYGVVSFSVGAVRSIPWQIVEHSPVFNDPEPNDIPNNRAHTDVFGPKARGDTEPLP
jgi:hypothetical protein